MGKAERCAGEDCVIFVKRSLLGKVIRVTFIAEDLVYSDIWRAGRIIQFKRSGGDSCIRVKCARVGKGFRG